jgi:hypothetical protein
MCVHLGRSAKYAFLHFLTQSRFWSSTSFSEDQCKQFGPLRHLAAKFHAGKCADPVSHFEAWQ